MKSSAVVVTYFPGSGFQDYLDAWVSQVDELVVVDNGTSPAWCEEISGLIQAKYPNVELIANGQNLGIATALNQGFARLIERGHRTAFVFDQDSVPAPGMVDELFGVYSEWIQRGPVAMVAPQIEIPSAKTISSFLIPRGKFLFQRVRCEGEQVLGNVSLVISSGSLFDLDAYQNIGHFRDDFFIDYVDTEYCLRAVEQGYEIIVACKARLRHQLGNQREGRLGPLVMHPTFHSPVRWYFISRNRIAMLFEYAFRFPHWLLYELLVNTYGLVRLVLFEDRKVAKLLAMWLGMRDGLAKQMGPIPTAHRDALALAERYW
jgi:rhamnosyltransferase